MSFNAADLERQMDANQPLILPPTDISALVQWFSNDKQLIPKDNRIKQDLSNDNRIKSRIFRVSIINASNRITGGEGIFDGNAMRAPTPIEIPPEVPIRRYRNTLALKVP